jgi:hypothetical protein
MLVQALALLGFGASTNIQAGQEYFFKIMISMTVLNLKWMKNECPFYV